MLVREIDHRQLGVIDEVARAGACRWIRIGRSKRRDSPRGRIEAVLEERQVALHIRDVEKLVVRRNQDAVGFLLSFINRCHGFSRQSVFTQAIDIEPPVSIADAEEKRTAAIETEVGGIVIQVHALMAHIGPVFRQRHHRTGHLAPFSAAARDLASPKLKDTPPEGLLVPIATAGDLAALCEVAATTPLPFSFLALELSPTLTPDLLQPLLAMSPGRLLLVRPFAATEESTLRVFAESVRQHGHFLACELTPAAAHAPPTVSTRVRTT